MDGMSAVLQVCLSLFVKPFGSRQLINLLQMHVVEELRVLSDTDVLMAPSSVMQIETNRYSANIHWSMNVKVTFSW